MHRNMFGYRFLRSAAVALGMYGVLGIFIAAAMLVVGSTTFTQVTTLQKTLESNASRGQVSSHGVGHPARHRQRNN